MATRSLCDNRIGDAGAEAIGEALKTNTTLWTLSLFYKNQIGQAGAEAIGAGLETNTRLIQLECVECGSGWQQHTI